MYANGLGVGSGGGPLGSECSDSGRGTFSTGIKPIQSSAFRSNPIVTAISRNSLIPASSFQARCRSSGLNLSMALVSFSHVDARSFIIEDVVLTLLLPVLTDRSSSTLAEERRSCGRRVVTFLNFAVDGPASEGGKAPGNNGESIILLDVSPFAPAAGVDVASAGVQNGL